MSSKDARQNDTLEDEEIQTKRLSRRSFISSTGIKFAVGAVAIAAGTRTAHAGDSKKTDMRDRNPPDPPSRDAD